MQKKLPDMSGLFAEIERLKEDIANERLSLEVARLRAFCEASMQIIADLTGRSASGNTERNRGGLLV